MIPELVIRQRTRRHQEGAGIPVPLTVVPDEELIATLVGLGQPRHDAEELRTNAQLRLAALRLWVDVGDAAKGDAQARERVDYVRDSFARMRAAELIADDPSRQHTDLIDPAELLP